MGKKASGQENQTLMRGAGKLMPVSVESLVTAMGKSRYCRNRLRKTAHKDGAGGMFVGVGPKPGLSSSSPVRAQRRWWL